MPTFDLVAEHFIVADGAAIRSSLCDESRWRSRFPELRLQVHEDRGDKGVRWLVSGARDGSAEVWLEPFRDGVIAHVFLRLEYDDDAARQRRRYGVPLQQWVFQVKDTLEHGRMPGEPRRIGSDRRRSEGARDG